MLGFAYTATNPQSDGLAPLKQKTAYSRGSWEMNPEGLEPSTNGLKGCWSKPSANAPNILPTSHTLVKGDQLNTKPPQPVVLTPAEIATVRRSGDMYTRDAFILPQEAIDRIQPMLHWPKAIRISHLVDVVRYRDEIQLHCGWFPTRSEELNSDIAIEVAVEFQRQCREDLRTVTVIFRGGEKHPIVY